MSGTRLVTNMGHGWRPFTMDNPLPLPCPRAVNELAVSCCSEEPSARPTFLEIIDILLGPCASEAGALDSALALAAEVRKAAEAREAMDNRGSVSAEIDRRKDASAQGDVELSGIYSEAGDGHRGSTNPLAWDRAQTPEVIESDLSSV